MAWCKRHLTHQAAGSAGGVSESPLCPLRPRDDSSRGLLVGHHSSSLGSSGDASTEKCTKVTRLEFTSTWKCAKHNRLSASHWPAWSPNIWLAFGTFRDVQTNFMLPLKNSSDGRWLCLCLGVTSYLVRNEATKKPTFFRGFPYEKRKPEGNRWHLGRFPYVEKDKLLVLPGCLVCRFSQILKSGAPACTLGFFRTSVTKPRVGLSKKSSELKAWRYDKGKTTANNLFTEASS